MHRHRWVPQLWFGEQANDAKEDKHVILVSEGILKM
jgi:hypothetical protein